MNGGKDYDPIEANDFKTKSDVIYVCSFPVLPSYLFLVLLGCLMIDQ